MGSDRFCIEFAINILARERCSFIDAAILYLPMGLGFFVLAFRSISLTILAGITVVLLLGALWLADTLN
jgi:hypothetical protein